jgi:hypothetical protein
MQRLQKSTTIQYQICVCQDPVQSLVLIRKQGCSLAEDVLLPSMAAIDVHDASRSCVITALCITYIYLSAQKTKDTSWARTTAQSTSIARTGYRGRRPALAGSGSTWPRKSATGQLRSSVPLCRRPELSWSRVQTVQIFLNSFSSDI